MIDRCVYVGGFGSGDELVQVVGDELTRRNDFREIEAFVFSDVVHDPSAFIRASRDASTVLTHSAGAMHAFEHAPNAGEVHAIAPPIYTSAFALATTRSLKKARTMHRGIDGPERKRAVKRYEIASMRELGAHPVRNFVMLGKIAAFDIREQNGFLRPVHAGFMTDDEFYPVTHPDDLWVNSGVNVVQLAGEHDELLLDPQTTLDDFYDAIGRIY